jgi:hypothetical protein
MAPAWVPQLAQRLGLDLPDPLARDREILSDFFQSVLAAVLQAEAHLDDFLFARRERLQHLCGLFAQIQIDHGVGRRHTRLVDQKIRQMRLFLFANWSFQRYRLLRHA